MPAPMHCAAAQPYSAFSACTRFCPTLTDAWAAPSPALARVCVVNSTGNVLLDRHVRPKEKVTDFRTKVSGRLACWPGSLVCLLRGWGLHSSGVLGVWDREGGRRQMG